MVALGWTGGIVVNLAFISLIGYSAVQNWGLALAASALYAAVCLACGAYLRKPRFAKDKADGFWTASDVLIMVGVFGVGVSLHFLPTNLMNCDMVWDPPASMVTPGAPPVVVPLGAGPNGPPVVVPTSMLSLPDEVTRWANTSSRRRRARRRRYGFMPFTSPSYARVNGTVVFSGFNGIEKDRFLFAARADEDVVVVDMVEGGSNKFVNPTKFIQPSKDSLCFRAEESPRPEGMRAFPRFMCTLDGTTVFNLHAANAHAGSFDDSYTIVDSMIAHDGLVFFKARSDTVLGERHPEPSNGLIWVIDPLARTVKLLTPPREEWPKKAAPAPKSIPAPDPTWYKRFKPGELTRDQCSVACQKNPECTGFGYGRRFQTCGLSLGRAPGSPRRASHLWLDARRDGRQRKRWVILCTTYLPVLALSLWIAVKWRVASMAVTVFISCCMVIFNVQEDRALACTNVFSALWLSGGAVCHISNRVLTSRELKWACSIGGVAYFTTMHGLLGIPSFRRFHRPDWSTWLLYDLICVVPLGVLGVLVNGNALLLLLAAFGMVMQVYFTLDALLVMVGVQSSGTLFLLTHFVVLATTGLSLVGAGFVYQRHAAQIQAAVDERARRSCRCIRRERT
jgi:hypothetical protein